MAREGWQATRAQSVEAHFSDIWNVLDALTHCGQLLTVILHVAGCDEARIAGAFTMLLLAWGVLFYLRGFEHTSFLVAMIWRAISDMHGFFVFMVILGYFTAFSFYVLNGYPT